MRKRAMRAAAAAISGILFLSGCGQTGGSQIQETEAQGQETSAGFEETDPELAAIARRFTEKVNQDSENLDERQKQLIAIVSLTAQQSTEMLRIQIKEALDSGLGAIEIREAVYQCAPYVGLSRAADAARITSQVFTENGVELPLEEQGTVDDANRFDLGLDAQAEIFGEGMRQIAQGGEEAMERSSFYLVDNCFGDYYTREGLDLETREMLTLAILVNLGTESQISSHITGNSNVGRSREFISDVIYQCLPYAGYPRILNALNCLNTALPEETSGQTVSAAVPDTEDIIFALGGENPAAEYFTGNTYLSALFSTDDVFHMPTTFHVTFEPCARTDWHSHDGGQILMATGGTGIHQIEGQPAQTLHPGDIVMVEPGVKHWHGASEDSWFSHIAISTNPENSGVNWMDPVTDEEYMGD